MVLLAVVSVVEHRVLVDQVRAMDSMWMMEGEEADVVVV